MGQRRSAANLAFSLDGSSLAAASNEGIHLWRLDEKSPAVEWLKPPPPPRSVIRDVKGSMKRLTFAAGDKKLFGLMLDVDGPSAGAGTGETVGRGRRPRGGHPEGVRPRVRGPVRRQRRRQAPRR